MMYSDKDKICRLCLKTCNGSFEIIEDVTKEMLEVLLVDMDFDISDNCVYCKKCTEMLQQCFQFKSICVHTEEKLILFIESRSIKRANMKQVYLEDTKNNNPTPLNTAEICRFCMKPITNFLALNEIIDEYFSDILKKFLPEVMLNITNNPVTCINCLDCLKSYFTFLKYLELVEGHIKAYCEAEREIKIEKVELNDVVQHILKRITEYVNNETKFTEDQLVELYFSRLTIIKNCFKDQRDISESKEVVEKQMKSIANVRHDKGIKTNMKTRELRVILRRENFSSFRNPTTLLSDQFRCPYCRYKASFNGHLVNHLERVHGIHFFSCQRCSYKTRDEDCLKKHQIIHGENATFECSECQKVFRTRRNIESHLITKHNLSDIVTAKIHPCNFCSFKTAYKSDLFNHVNSKHLHMKKYQCGYCSRTFLRKVHLELHITSVHLKLRPYNCNGCKKTFSEKTTLDCHIVSHHPTNEYLMKTVTSKINNCDHCSYKSTKKSLITRHMEVHKKPKPHICTVCKRTFSKKRNLDRHIVLYHPKDKGLMKTVTTSKIHSCDYCSYISANRMLMAIHNMETHDKQLRPYICTGCEKTFTKKKYLDPHIVSYHPKDVGLMKTVTCKIHSCNHCSYKTAKKMQMMQHKQTHDKRLNI